MTPTLVPRVSLKLLLAFICAALGAAGLSARQSGEVDQANKRPTTSAEGFGAQLQQPGHRRLLVVPEDKPLLSHIRPEDTFVDIVDVSLRGASSGLPEGQSVIESMTRRSAAVAVVRVARVASQLTADGRWIESAITGTLEDVRKTDAGAPLTRAADIGFTSRGGTIVVGKTRIRAQRHNERPFESGRSYLIFFDTDRSGSFTATAARSLEVQDNALTPMLIDGPLKFVPNISNKDAVLHEISTFSLVR